MFRGILKFFVPAFLLFFVVGSVAGWEVREDTALKNIYKNLEVKKRDDKYHLFIACRGFVFDTDTDESRIESDIFTNATYHETVLGTPSERHMEIVSLISTFIGGATGGYTIKDVLSGVSQKSRSFWSWNQLKKTLFSVLGAITGYSAGKLIASNYDTSCESDIAAEVLGKSATWRDFEVKFLTASIQELKTTEGAIILGTKLVNQSPWEADPIYSCPTALTSSVDDLDRLVSETDPNPRSLHYQTLDDIKTVYKRVKSTEVYKWLLRMRIYKFITKRTAKSRAIAESRGYSDELWDARCQSLNVIVSRSIGQTPQPYEIH